MKKIVKMLMTIMVLMLALSVYPVKAEAASKPAVKVSKSKATIYVGAKLQLKQTGTAKKYTWWSNNQKVATVNSKGIVTAKRKGTASIVLKAGSKKSRCTVTVKNNLTAKQVVKKMESQAKNYKNLTMSVYTKSVKSSNLIMQMGLNKKDKIIYTNLGEALTMYITDDKTYVYDTEEKKWFYQKREEKLDAEEFDMGDSFPETATYKLLSHKTFNGIRAARLQVTDKEEGTSAIYYFDLCDYSLIGNENKEDGEKVIMTYNFKKTVKVPSSVIKKAVKYEATW